MWSEKVWEDVRHAVASLSGYPCSMAYDYDSKKEECRLCGSVTYDQSTIRQCRRKNQAPASWYISYLRAREAGRGSY